MQMQIFKKGATYKADCRKCGATNFTHEWFHMDHTVDPDTFMDIGRHYAGWYSMPGYLDHTSVEYDTNLRRLKSTLRDYYGEEV